MIDVTALRHCATLPTFHAAVRGVQTDLMELGRWAAADRIQQNRRARHHTLHNTPLYSVLWRDIGATFRADSLRARGPARSDVHSDGRPLPTATVHHGAPLSPLSRTLCLCPELSGSLRLSPWLRPLSARCT